MSDDLQKTADGKLEEAVKRTGSRDPREFYRKRLRDLKASDASAYARAVQYYRDDLVPAVAKGDVDPLAAWTEYGRVLAALTAPGRTVALDSSGRAEPYAPGMHGDRLILHVPEQKDVRTLLVSLPRELSPAQRASYDWLVAGRQTLPS